MELIAALEKTVSPDKNELEAAQQYLYQAAQSDLLNFLKSLSEILTNVGNSPVARMAASLQLKNALTSKDPDVRLQCQQNWLALPDDIRNYIKMNVLNALGTENFRPSSAAQCVAYIAVAELPHMQWIDLIPRLTTNVTNNSSTEMIKEATLEAIGYICQDIDPEVLENRSNDILTAIVHGMRKDEPSDHVRLAATTALQNSLEFTKSNFDKDSERHFIMQVVCEATQSPNSQVRIAALQCLVKVMSLYYHHMEHYMGPALFAITVEAMKSDIDDVALQGIEFWSNVCDEEVDLAIELSEAEEQGIPPSRTSRFYAKGALRYLVPILTQRLTKQEEHDDEDDWNPCKAAGVCLMLLANCCEDDVVPHILPFVKDNIKHPDWRFRDAAVMAFGSFLEGPDSSILKPLVEQALPMLIELMADQSVVVRDTVAWTFGRVCELVPDAALSDTYLQPLLEVLIKGLEVEPRVAANICWAFSSLAAAAYEATEVEDEETEPDTYCLSPYFEGIVSKLLATTERPDSTQNNLRNAAYEALMELIKNSARDCYTCVQKTTMIILQRLQHILALEGNVQTSADKNEYNDMQSLLCATLQSVLRKMTPEDAPKISDAIMTALLQMFNTGSFKGGVQEDALMALSTLAEVMGENFIKYMDAIRPFLTLGLKNHAEYQVCAAAVGLTGDICRALGSKVLPYCDEIMVMLLENLANENLHQSVKPQILTVFGDIALAIGSEFRKFLDVVFTTLVQASAAQIDKNGDYEVVYYLNDLREGCLVAYTGIIQGLKDSKNLQEADLQLLLARVPYIVQLITVVAQDPDHSDCNIASCAGLIGDLCSAFGANILPLLDNDIINDLLAKGRKSKVTRTKTLTSWACKEIRKLKNATGAAVS